jgi:hypothetical protein
MRAWRCLCFHLFLTDRADSTIVSHLVVRMYTLLVEITALSLLHSVIITETPYAPERRAFANSCQCLNVYDLQTNLKTAGL